jgi:predicted amidohydrolase YtcJ
VSKAAVCMRGAALAACVAIQLISRPATAEESHAITVFVARKIVTMDPGWPLATAVAVQDGRVLSVGSLADLKPWLARFPHSLDRSFASKILLPGFIEPHGHPLLGGTSLTRPLLSYLPTPNPYGPAFPGVKTRPAAFAKLREYVANAKSPGETVLSWGYDVIAMGGKHLTKTELDEISTTQPILVWDASEHFVYANSAALRKYAVTRADTRTNGVMAGPDGEPNGQFLGTTAAHRILEKPLIELFQPEVALRNVRYLMDLSRQHGITTTSDLAFGAVNLSLEQVLFDTYFEDPKNPMRCVVVTDATSITAKKGEQAIAFVKGLAAGSTDKLIFNGVKFFADDSFLSLGMVMEDPGYTDGRKGIFITPPNRMVELWRPWWEAGFQIHVHSNGNGGNHATIDALASLMRLEPRADHRFTLEHYGMSTPEMARRLARLGGLASVNPYYLYARSELNAPYVGSDRAYTAARLRTLVDAGVPTSLHTDTPVAPPFPLEEVWIAVNRFGLSGRVRGPDERVSVDQALRMVTTDAAFTLGVEDRVGSIAPGKQADFAVLEQDPYAVAKQQIRNIKVWGTVFGGRIFPASEIRPQ